MGRLLQWDYTRPYYYMVTLKCLPGLPPLSILDAEDAWGFKRDYTLTQVLSKEIIDFADSSPGIASIKPFVLMPDHIHLLVKLADTAETRTLQMYIRMLKAVLRNRFRMETGIDTVLFETEWHDLIVKKRAQLPNFIHYILRNPQMSLLRQAHKTYFHCYRAMRHWRLGEQTFDFVGNPELLDEPALLAVRISRKVHESTSEWAAMMQRYAQWKPGMTAVGTWWSKGEQAACRLILERGGYIIRLDPVGFGERWHPAGDEAQSLCAEGRILHLSPYLPQTARLPEGETRQRCLALNNLAQAMAQAIYPLSSTHIG